MYIYVPNNVQADAHGDEQPDEQLLCYTSVDLFRVRVNV